MRIIFMGTPDFSVPTLRSLVEAGHDVVAVYTQPPRPGGRRGKELTPTPVHKAAEDLGIDVRHPVTLKDLEAQADFAALEADVAVVAAYGLLLPQAILDAPKHGCLNVHASLLPRWRGAAPIQRAILAGDPATGVTIMQMELGLDTGPMLANVHIPVDAKTTGELTDELAIAGAKLMVRVLSDLGAYKPEKQHDLEATYARKIDKSEAKIDFTRDAEFIERQIRAFAPFPGAWFELDGARHKVFAAQIIGREGAPGTVMDDELTIACGHACFRPTRIQRAGKPAMDTGDLLRGKPVAAGTVIA